MSPVSSANAEAPFSSPQPLPPSHQVVTEFHAFYFCAFSSLTVPVYVGLNKTVI